MLIWSSLLDDINWRVGRVGVKHYWLWVYLTAVPDQKTSNNLYGIMEYEKVCPSYLFLLFVYKVCGILYVGFYIPTFPVGGMHLIHSQ